MTVFRRHFGLTAALLVSCLLAVFPLTNRADDSLARRVSRSRTVRSDFDVDHGELGLHACHHGLEIRTAAGHGIHLMSAILPAAMAVAPTFLVEALPAIPVCLTAPQRCGGTYRGRAPPRVQSSNS
jgi:hypothetical protein